jgi:hypothetical protein
MFPTGRPGIALLLLRAGLSSTLLHAVLSRSTTPDSTWIVAAIWLVAIALCVGFLTPVTAALYVVIQITAWPISGAAIEPLQVCAILIAVALAMLGPGGYSFDARLFGRRQVIFPAHGEHDK